MPTEVPVPNRIEWTSIPAAVLAERPPAGDKPAVSYRAAGDRHILVEYGAAEFDMLLNFFTQSVNSALLENGVRGVVEGQPGFRSIMLVLDGSAPSDQVIAELDEIHESIPALDKLVLKSRTIRLPMAFDDSASRDAVARYLKGVRSDAVNCEGGNNVDYTMQYNGITEPSELISHVTSTDLWTGFLGFFPGLPFMFPLDPRHVLFAPKYNPTRTWTQEGAVGLGGPAYSIYPVESPGGYQLLGRTIPVYDVLQRNGAFRESPVLMRPSDRIRFFQVSEDEINDTFERVHSQAYEYQIEDGAFDVGEYKRHVEQLAAEVSAWEKRRNAAAAVTPVP